MVLFAPCFLKVVAALANPEEIDLGDDGEDEDGDGMQRLEDHSAAEGGLLPAGADGGAGHAEEAPQDDPMFQPL